MMCIKMKCIIPDTSAVIIGAVSELIENGDFDYPEIIVPEAVVCELEHQANAKRSEGIKGFIEESIKFNCFPFFTIFCNNFY